MGERLTDHELRQLADQVDYALARQESFPAMSASHLRLLCREVMERRAFDAIRLTSRDLQMMITMAPGSSWKAAIFELAKHRASSLSDADVEALRWVRADLGEQLDDARPSHERRVRQALSVLDRLLGDRP